MTNTPIRATSAPLASEATVVEQARAIAEVQAAVTVAQSVPRDLEQIRAEVQQSCTSPAIAERAFFSLPRGSSSIEGKSVHLARELARIWGNIDYGIRELRRDDDAQISEMQGYAWDQQKNTRSTRSFIVPHARMKARRREVLTDLGDISLNNNANAARAVRECIFTVLPGWLVAEAEHLCKQTLEGPPADASGTAPDLTGPIRQMLEAFNQLNVTEDMVTARIGRPRAQWNPADLARLKVDFNTIRNGEATVEDLFGGTHDQSIITPADLTGTNHHPEEN